MGLKIKSIKDCELDLVSLGECMLRLSPPAHDRIETTPYFQAYAGGGEYNVAYALARYGLNTAWIGKLVDNPIGAFIRRHGQASGMDFNEVLWEPYDGIGKKNRIGINFTEVGTGIRSSVTIYDRGHSATMNMKPGEIEWDRIFNKRGVRWFHLGGIFTALSEGCAEVAFESMKAAHESGTIVSYDLNFRSKLWTSEKAIKVTRNLLPYIDVLFGNEEDFEKVLGFEIHGTDNSFADLKVENYKNMVSQVLETYPHLKVVATTLREVVTGLINNWSALIYHDGEFYQSHQFKNLEIEDRVGGGDGFCSGIIYGFLKEFVDLQEIVEFGTVHGALLQSTRGDTSVLTVDEVMNVIKGGSARIKR